VKLFVFALTLVLTPGVFAAPDEAVLGKAEGNQSAAAAMLGIDRNTLRKKIQQLRIKA